MQLWIWCLPGLLVSTLMPPWPMSFLDCREGCSLGPRLCGTQLSLQNSRSSSSLLFGREPNFSLRLKFLGIENMCKLCNQQEEDLPHLFFACPLAAEVWTDIKNWAGLRKSMTTIKSSVKWPIKESRGSSWKCNWRKLCFAATLYHLWEYKNKVYIWIV